MSHQGSFSFVFSSMKNKESLSIVSRTFDLEINQYRKLGKYAPKWYEGGDV